MRILIIGSGGREHALAWKISQRADVEELYVAPGNGGTASLAVNVSVSKVAGRRYCTCPPCVTEAVCK